MNNVTDENTPAKKRGTRKGTVLLQPRDYEILHAIYRHRFLNMELLHILFPPMEPQGNRVAPPPAKQSDEPTRETPQYAYLYRPLRRLVKREYLHRVRQDLSEEYAFIITSGGMDILNQYLARTEPLGYKKPPTHYRETKKGTKIATLKIEHALMVARFRILLEVALASRSDMELSKQARASITSKCEWERAGKSFAVDPDALIQLTQVASGRKLHFFIEADRATMGSTAMGEKYESYYLMHKHGADKDFYGYVRWRVLTITTTKARANNLAYIPSTKKRLPSADTSEVRWRERMPASEYERFLYCAEDEFRHDPEQLLKQIMRIGGAKEYDKKKKLLPPKRTAIIPTPEG